jgi:peptidoglycan/xylan/chitin deacetylase (PgdA/CDA1 family)
MARSSRATRSASWRRRGIGGVAVRPAGATRLIVVRRWQLVLAAAVAAALVLASRSVARAFTQQERGWAATQAGLLYFVQTSAPAVALTFDDGPDPAETPQVLAMLRAAGARATFFVLANSAERHPDIVRAILAEGSEVGSHSVSHPDMGRMAAAAVVREASASVAAIAKITGRPVTLFRFPYFSHTSAGVAAVRGLGLTVVEASVDPKDWANPGVAAIVRRATESVRPGDIILFHDGGGHAQTLAALPQVMAALRQRGLQMVTVSELLRMGAPSYEVRP